MSTETTTTLRPEIVAEHLGLTIFELDEQMRGFAAGKLETLASRIRRGHESIEGDVDAEEFNSTTEVVYRLLESAQACTKTWQAEADKESE